MRKRGCSPSVLTGLLLAPILACTSSPMGTAAAGGRQTAGMDGASPPPAVEKSVATQVPPASANAPVEVKVVKYDGLKDAVKNCKGKILVVDVWSTT